MSNPLLSEVSSSGVPPLTDQLLVLPVGAMEAHGPHLPLGSDLLQAEATAKDLARRVRCVVAPGIPYGVCPGTRGFPGTVSISPGTLARLTEDLTEGFYRTGFRKFLILSGHGAAAHMAALREGVGTVVSRHPEVRAAVLCDYEFVYELRGKDAPATDGHAGLLETSRVMALAPEQVGPARPSVEYRVHRSVVGDPSREDWPDSVMGDTRGASAETGRRIHAHVMDRLVETVATIFGGA